MRRSNDRTFKRSNVILIGLFAVILFSCAPSETDFVSGDSVQRLDTTQALIDWNRTQEETDGCSSTAGLHWFAETFLDKNWNVCCVQHDFDYRYGETYGITREQADFELWACVTDAGHPMVANAVYSAVHLLGWRYYHRN